MTGGYYVFAEDLASGLVGPFGTVEEARAHVKFCEARGDADPGCVVTAKSAETLRPDVGLEMTPDQDRACPACGARMTDRATCPEPTCEGELLHGQRRGR